MCICFSAFFTPFSQNFTYNTSLIAAVHKEESCKPSYLKLYITEHIWLWWFLVKPHWVDFLALFKVLFAVMIIERLKQASVEENTRRTKDVSYLLLQLGRGFLVHALKSVKPGLEINRKWSQFKRFRQRLQQSQDVVRSLWLLPIAAGLIQGVEENGFHVVADQTLWFAQEFSSNCFGNDQAYLGLWGKGVNTLSFQQSIRDSPHCQVRFFSWLPWLGYNTTPRLQKDMC